MTATPLVVTHCISNWNIDTVFIHYGFKAVLFLCKVSLLQFLSDYTKHILGV